MNKKAMKVVVLILLIGMIIGSFGMLVVYFMS